MSTYETQCCHCKTCENYKPKTNITLQQAWEKRSKFYAEGNKLCAEGNKLCAEGDKLRAEGDKLRAEGDKLRAEGDKLRAEGDLIFINTVLEVYGNVKIEWRDNNAVVEGVEYK